MKALDAWPSTQLCKNEFVLSSRARFATRALVELSRQHGKGPVRIEDIAERQNIPLKYLQHILLELKTEGFLDSRKGPGGGYTLARPPENITLASVLRAMDGPIAPVSCVSVFSYQECGCPDPETCTLRLAFSEVREAMVSVLDRTTFADLSAGRVVPGLD
jgi:Rrf2 family protein